MVDWLLCRLILGTCKCFQLICKLLDCIFDRSMQRSYNIWMHRETDRKRGRSTRGKDRGRERQREREHCSESENCRGLGTCLISWQRIIVQCLYVTHTHTHTWQMHICVCVCVCEWRQHVVNGDPSGFGLVTQLPLLLLLLLSAIVLCLLNNKFKSWVGSLCNMRSVRKYPVKVEPSCAHLHY